MNIMILDDEPKIRNGMVRLLQDTFGAIHTIHSFGDSAEAFAFLQQHHIDLLFTDIRMPGQSGLTLVDTLQQQGHHFEVVILSGYSEFSYAQKAIDLKVRKYLTKPSDPEEILAVVREVDAALASDSGLRKRYYSGDHPVILRCLDYVSRNYAQKFTLEDLGEVLFLSSSYLCRLFKKETGMNLSDFITAYRIEIAKSLLPEPNLSIQQVAEQVGYRDPAYFAASFKKATGMTPHQYRMLGIDGK